MENKIKVLIVDDSFFMRKLLRDILHSDPEIKVIGDARDGEEAIEKVCELKPDVVTMDYNLPKMNGTQVTKEILQCQKCKDYNPAIIMISAYTTEGAEVTLESLKAGAVDFVPKPSGELSLDIEKIGQELIKKIKIVAHTKVRITKPKIAVREKIVISYKIRKKILRAKIIIIGASTGGPPIVEEIVAKLPAELQVPIFIAQHMPKQFTETFAKRLDALSGLIVREAEEDDIIKSGMVLVAPGGSVTSLEKEDQRVAVKLDQISKTKINSTPDINVLMQSAAEIYGKNTLGIILTGMGDDGLEGAKAIKKAGGHVIAQAPQTAVISSMPQSVIDAKLADEVLTPEEISQRIGGIVYV